MLAITSRRTVAPRAWSATLFQKKASLRTRNSTRAPRSFGSLHSAESAEVSDSSNLPRPSWKRPWLSKARPSFSRRVASGRPSPLAAGFPASGELEPPELGGQGGLDLPQPGIETGPARLYEGDSCRHAHLVDDVLGDQSMARLIRGDLVGLEGQILGSDR